MNWRGVLIGSTAVIGMTAGLAPAIPAQAAVAGSVAGGGWQAVAAGGWHTRGLRAGGSLWCWGSNSFGQLGDGSTTDRTAPVATAMAAATTWTAVSTGGWHSCGIRSDASLWCWGNNSYGQLGDGSTTSSPVPVRVGAAAGWVDVAAGSTSTCGVDTDGGLWCWGNNAVGQLGDNTITGRPRPVRIGAATGWVRVAAGQEHSCALRSDATLWCWGTNEYGELGNGTTYHRIPGQAPLPSVPGKVAADVGWAGVAVGSWHTCGVDTAGGLWCWGNDGFGALGDGSTGNQAAPVPVGTGNTWRQVSAGYYFSCAVATDGSTWCWGANDEGQLGVAGPASRAVPAPAGAGHGWQAVATGRLHACAIGGGALSCWGSNRYGQLGDATGVSSLTSPAPLRVTAAGAGGWTGASAATGYACAVDTTGGLWCWGRNDIGQLGDGSTTDRPRPGRVAADVTWARVDTSFDAHACATDTGGGAWCWGRNFWAQLGDGSTADRQVPVPVRAAGDGQAPVPVSSVAGGQVPVDAAGWAQVTTGDDDSCAVRADGTLWCWGLGWDQGAGVPTRVGTDADWGLVEGGQYPYAACGIRAGGTLWCATLDYPDPVWQQIGTDTGWVGVSSGSGFTCATRSDHTLWCWGQNLDGQLGTGSTASSDTPAQVGAGASWASVSAGVTSTCATRTDGTLWCWGDNAHLQLGRVGVDSVTLPVQVGAWSAWAGVSVGDGFTCATRADTSLWCWGYDASGQLGMPIPTPVHRRVR